MDKYLKDIVNVNGGAIALGHPIGTGGCRTLIFEMIKRESRIGPGHAVHWRRAGLRYDRGTPVRERSYAV